MFFFFKQKTAYEMRISDWSSDVCSSDLTPPASGTRSVRVDRTQPEEPSLAPYAHHPSSADRILALDSHLDEAVEGGAVDQRLQSAANLDIGSRLAAGRIDLDTEGMLGLGHHGFVKIGPEDQLDILGFGRRLPRGAIDVDRHEGGVLHQDGAALDRRDQPVGAVQLPSQDRGEQLDQR